VLVKEGPAREDIDVETRNKVLVQATLPTSQFTSTTHYAIESESTRCKIIS
jgi:hypothetical protein